MLPNGISDHVKPFSVRDITVMDKERLTHVFIDASVQADGLHIQEEEVYSQQSVM